MQENVAEPPAQRHGGRLRKFVRSLFSQRQLKAITKRDDSLRVDFKQITDHNLNCKGVSGTGTFGIVYKANAIDDPKALLAVKRIELDDETETREIELHKMAHHQNVVGLNESWAKRLYKGLAKKVHVYMVMEYLPKNLEDQIHDHAKEYTTISTLLIKVFSYQMFRALNYLHQIRILHRDVKPSSLLIDANSGVLKICDFGCAKFQKKLNTPNRTYICSRYYRAPELVMHNPRNDQSIDVWAAACVLAECFRGWPLFPGKSSAHQYGAIADVLGNPTPEEMFFLNPVLKQMNVKVRDASATFDEHFPPGTPELAMDLLAKMLVYVPKDRVSCLGACADPYYDQLRLNVNTLTLPSGAPLPRLFDFSPKELQNTPAYITERLFPTTMAAGAYLDESTSITDSKNYIPDSLSSGSTQESVDEAFSERESLDVDECDLWDCQRIRVVDDEASSLSS